MQAYILDTEYNKLGVIDDAESIIWHKKYNDIGECEIYVPCNADYISLLKRGHYIYREDDDMFCKINEDLISTDIENGDYFTATARDACIILSGRIVRWQITYTGTVAGFIEKLLNDNVINPEQSQRKIANFKLDKSNFSELTERIEQSVNGDDLLQLIISTCKSVGYGFRVSYDIDSRELIFKLYKGKNKASAQGAEYVEFSPQFANIRTSQYKESDANYKNVVYIRYTDEKNVEKLLSVYIGNSEPQGEKRREVLIDGTGVSRDMTKEELLKIHPTATEGFYSEEDTTKGYYYIRQNGQSIVVANWELTGEGDTAEERITASDYTYIPFVREEARAAFAQYTETQEFIGTVDTIDTYEYKTDYDLGDIVKVVNEYGIEAETRIIEIMESDDNEDGYIVEPIFEFNNT